MQLCISIVDYHSVFVIFSYIMILVRIIWKGYTVIYNGCTYREGREYYIIQYGSKQYNYPLFRLTVVFNIIILYIVLCTV